jgi:hypothetical protein
MTGEMRTTGSGLSCPPVGLSRQPSRSGTVVAHLILPNTHASFPTPGFGRAQEAWRTRLCPNVESSPAETRASRRGIRTGHVPVETLRYPETPISKPPEIQVGEGRRANRLSSHPVLLSTSVQFRTYGWPLVTSFGCKKRQFLQRVSRVRQKPRRLLPTTDIELNAAAY